MNRVLISVVTKGNVSAETCGWLVAFAASQPHHAVDIVSTPLPLVHARNLSVKRFLGTTCTQYYTLDADCVPAPKTIERLLAYELPVVVSPHACSINGETGVMACDRTPEGYVQHHPMEGLRRVDAVGGSGVMIKREVIEKLGAPWYMMEYDANGLLSCGEDFYLSRRLTEAGYEIWADFTLVQWHKGVRQWPTT